MSNDAYMDAIREQTEVLRELNREVRALRAELLKQNRKTDAPARAVSRAQRLVR